MVRRMEQQPAALNSVFQALADPTRRAVIGRLGRGAATVSELAAPFDMALPSFMRHIGVLEESRLIVSRKNGRVRICELDRAGWAAFERWFEEQRSIWQSRYENLDTLLNELNGAEHEA